MIPTHTASEVLLHTLKLHGVNESALYDVVDSALATMTTDLLAILPSARPRLSETYNETLSDRKVVGEIRGYNQAIEDMTTALYEYMGRPELAIDKSDVPSLGSVASDEGSYKRREP